MGQVSHAHREGSEGNGAGLAAASEDRHQPRGGPEGKAGPHG